MDRYLVNGNGTGKRWFDSTHVHQNEVYCTQPRNTSGVISPVITGIDLYSGASEEMKAYIRSTSKISINYKC